MDVFLIQDRAIEVIWSSEQLAIRSPKLLE